MEEVEIVIAIDGPAGSGKSTVARKVAEKLGIDHLDSGAFYRAYTWELLNRKMDIKKNDLSSMINETIVELQEGALGPLMLLNGKDVTEEIRKPAVTALVSAVAENSVVRERVKEILRRIAREKSIVVDGRDIGTVVFPEAELKIYLDASIEERAKRRYLERVTKDEIDLELIKQDLQRRDKHDSEREIAPLCEAADAVVVDTTDLTVDKVTELIIEHARALNFEP